MGNYIFETEALYRELKLDAAEENSSHDFGKDIIPSLFPRAPVYVYDYSTNVIPGEKPNVSLARCGDARLLLAGAMDLVADDAPFSLQSQVAAAHPLPALPPATFIDTDDCKVKIANSLISGGCFIQGSQIQRSILGFRCNIGPCSHISESVLLGM